MNRITRTVCCLIAIALISVVILGNSTAQQVVPDSASEITPQNERAVQTPQFQVRPGTSYEYFLVQVREFAQYNLLDMPDEELLRQAFHAADVDSDGQLDQHEIAVDDRPNHPLKDLYSGTSQR
jgi:hypothetical protein